MMLGIAQELERLKFSAPAGTSAKAPPRYRYITDSGEVVTGRLYELMKYKHRDLKEKTVEQRLRYGWDITRALNTPPREYKVKH